MYTMYTLYTMYPSSPNVYIVPLLTECIYIYIYIVYNVSILAECIHCTPPHRMYTLYI